MSTGMRRGDVLGLTWDHVDTDAVTVHAGPHTAGTQAQRTLPRSSAGPVFLARDCPARGHRVQAALRASLRDGLASLDPATTRDSAPMRTTDWTKTYCGNQMP
jgi:integrase